MTQLVTGEAVALDLRPAALPSRLVAAAIDTVLQSLVLFALFLALALAQVDLSEALIATLSVIFVVLTLAGYPIAFETLWRGRTPGKAAMGLRVVRDDGGPVAFRQALVRGLAGMFLERPGITLFVGAVGTSLLNSSSKRLGDLLAGTLVLQERVPSRQAQPVPMPFGLEAWAAELDLGGLTDDLASSARAFVVRSPDLTTAAREQLGAALVAEVAAVVGPPAPPGTPGWAYLSAVLAERRRRAEPRYGGGAPVPTYVPAALPGTYAQRDPFTPTPVPTSPEAAPAADTAPTRPTVPRKAAPRKAPAKKAAGSTTPTAAAKKASTKTVTSTPVAPAKTTAKKAPATKAPAAKAPAKKTAARKAILPDDAQGPGFSLPS